MLAASPVPARGCSGNQGFRAAADHRSGFTVDTAVMGGSWDTWRSMPTIFCSPRSDTWSDRLRSTPCHPMRQSMLLASDRSFDPLPDEKRDHGIVAQYFNPHTFLWWLRNLLKNSPGEAAGGDWDADQGSSLNASSGNGYVTDLGSMPMIEEILRAWARDSSAFMSGDQKAKAYLDELERWAVESEISADVQLLKTCRNIWDTLAKELG
jgi:hypothetical protein